MVNPTLKSNAGDQKVYKKKNLSWVFGVDRKIGRSGSLFGITRQSLVMPNSDSRTDFTIRTSHPWKILIFQTIRYCMRKGLVAWHHKTRGARWLSGRVSDSGARGPGFETYLRRVVSLSKILYSPKVLVNYPGSDGSVPTWLKNCWLGR